LDVGVSVEWRRALKCLQIVRQARQNLHASGFGFMTESIFYYSVFKFRGERGFSEMRRSGWEGIFSKIPSQWERSGEKVFLGKVKIPFKMREDFVRENFFNEEDFEDFFHRWLRERRPWWEATCRAKAFQGNQLKVGLWLQSSVSKGAALYSRTSKEATVYAPVQPVSFSGRQYIFDAVPLGLYAPEWGRWIWQI
jgi:hypothetical protein